MFIMCVSNTLIQPMYVYTCAALAKNCKNKQI